MNNVLFEFKFENKSLIFFDNNNYILVSNSCILYKGSYVISEDSGQYKTFIMKSDDSHIAAVMVDFNKKLAFYTFKKGRLSKNRFVKI
jgi:hypothetical protein